MEKYEIISFKNDDVQIDVSVSPDQETVWLTLEQMSQLFNRDKSVINRHINAIYKNGELEKESTIAKNATMLNGRQYVLYLYNLDVIISVGYRVKSKNGIIFRKWANQVLKDYLLKGYCISNRAYITQENYMSLCNKVISLDDDVKRLKKEIANIKPNPQIFYKGQYFESLIFINDIINSIDNELTIIDPYFDAKALENFKINKNIKCILITSLKSKINDALLANFSKEYFPILKKINDDVHDRFIIVDNKTIFHIGTSLNYLGNKTFIINKIEDVPWSKEFIERIKDL